MPEEVFKINVAKGATINLTVANFQSTVGTKALLDVRWGGSCSVKGGAGTNKIACSQSTATPTVAWKNDQTATQTVYFTLEPAAGSSTTNKFITGHYMLTWDVFMDACSGMVQLAGSSGTKNGALKASMKPPAWSKGFNSLCSIANKTEMRDMIFYADVPAYNSIKLELSSNSKLIMEGRLQGDSASKVVFGTRGSNTCPSSSKLIVDEKACRTVATSKGYTFQSVMTAPNYQKGCLLYNDNVNRLTDVYFNKHGVGVGMAYGSPICEVGDGSVVKISFPTYNDMLKVRWYVVV